MQDHATLRGKFPLLIGRQLFTCSDPFLHVVHNAASGGAPCKRYVDVEEENGKKMVSCVQCVHVIGMVVHLQHALALATSFDVLALLTKL